MISVKEVRQSDNPLFLGVGYVVVFLLCIPLFFIGLGTPPLLDPDEPVYASTGRQMLLSGNFASWWSPHYNGALWFDKPPMAYWLIGLSMRVFGQNSLGARFPSAFCALLLVILTAMLTKRLWPRSTMAPIWSAAVIASSLMTIILARAAVTDMILAVFLTVAIVGMWNWLVDDRQIAWLMFAGASTGLAALTKGPVAIVLVGGAVLFYLLIMRQAKKISSPWLWGSLILSLAIALPWYVSMIHLHGQVFIQGFLDANNLTRYLRPEHPKTSSSLWFLPVFIGFIFPWTVPLILGAPSAWKATRAGDRGALYAVIWVVWVFVFFSASQTKLLTYIYPIFPAAAAWIGKWIDDEPVRWQRLFCGIAFTVVAGLIAIILPGYVGNGAGLSAARPALKQIDIVFAVAAALSLLSLAPNFEQSKLRQQMVFVIPAVCMGAFIALIALSNIWKQDLPDLSMTGMAALIARETPPGEPAIAMALKKPSLVYYSSRQILFIEDRKQSVRLMMMPPYPVCVIKNIPTQNPVSAVRKLFPTGHFKLLSQSSLKYVLIKYQR